MSWSRAILAILLAAPAVACSPNLGERPFLCNPGTPRCPDGYECKSNVCVKQGTCPEDLPECQPSGDCGNGTCDPGETNASCPGDCKETTCGNGACDADRGETAASCPVDCSAAKCGNGKCEVGETTASCAVDCPASKCGDGSCDIGESATSCPADCATSKCGDGKCDVNENSTTCPADCASSCTGDQTKCDGTDKLRYCENNTWKSDTCENMCKAGSFDYSAGCSYSSAKAKDVCVCGDYVTFGGLCDDKLKCDPSLFCGVFGSGTEGFCTKYCTNSGGTCSGAPAGTSATCTLQVSGKYACGFDCDYANCPTDLTCDFMSGLCMP